MSIESNKLSSRCHVGRGGVSINVKYSPFTSFHLSAAVFTVSWWIPITFLQVFKRERMESKDIDNCCFAKNDKAKLELYSHKFPKKLESAKIYWVLIAAL